jgi:hypothetical protein
MRSPGGGGEGDGGLARSDTAGREVGSVGSDHCCRNGAAVETQTQRGHDSAFMARRAHGRGHVAAMWRRCADERARRGGRETDRWDTQQRFFELKTTPGRKQLKTNS